MRFFAPLFVAVLITQFVWVPRGGSRGIVLPKPFLDQLALDEHGEFEITRAFWNSSS